MSDDDALPLPELEAMEEDARRRLRDLRGRLWRAGASKHPTSCTSCQASIRWALTTSDPPRWMPLDDRPHIAGTVAVVRDGGAPVAMVGPPAETPGPRYLPHWATCPAADRHRRRT